MKILVSACLLGKNCKYNGGNNLNQSVLDFIEGHEVIGVCPEQLGGLSTPRLPAEIVDGVVTNKEGVSVDAEFRKGGAGGVGSCFGEQGGFGNSAVAQSQLRREGDL